MGHGCCSRPFDTVRVVSWLHTAVKIGGAAYLMYLGSQAHHTGQCLRGRHLQRYCRDAGILGATADLRDGFRRGRQRARMPLAFRRFYAVLVRERMADKERQEAAVKASGLNWTLVQPVGLTDQPGTGSALTSSNGEIGTSQISRDDVARIVVEELDGSPHLRTTLAVSGRSKVDSQASERT